LTIVPTAVASARVALTGAVSVTVRLSLASRTLSDRTGTLTLTVVEPAGTVTVPVFGSIVQKGGKIVHAWAVEGDLDPDAAHSNLFETEWPPRSGRRATFPEIDRVAWFRPAEARVMIKPTQIPLLDRLEAALDGRA